MIALVLLVVTACAYAAEPEPYCLKNGNIEIFHENEISKDGKCYIACLYNCSSIVLENGDLDVDKIIEAWKHYNLDANVVQEMTKTLNNCIAQAQKVKNDPCEYGYQGTMCLKSTVSLNIRKFLMPYEAYPLYDAIIKSSKESELYISALFMSLSANNGKCSHRPM